MLYGRAPMLSPTDDVRIEHLKPLIPPAILMEELPASEADLRTVAQARTDAGAIISGEQSRLLVVVGPCSVHDPAAGLEYAGLLKTAADRFADDLCILMRAYFEKPRTIVGWKGLVNDPGLDGTFAINHGLRVARGFLRDVVHLGVPTATEFLDPITPQFIADLVSWGAIGARTSESQVHRELASGLSMPVGFKNGTDGNVRVAIDGIRSSAHSHHFLSVTKQGLAAIVKTRGNNACHLILRGGADGPNFDAQSVSTAVAQLTRHQLPPRLMVDCSHANSGKDHNRQAAVAGEIASRVAAGDPEVCGVMLESFLKAGRQSMADPAMLEYGRSITDACMDWATTEAILEQFAQSQARRRTS